MTEFSHEVEDGDNGRTYHCLILGDVEASEPGDEVTPPFRGGFVATSLTVLHVESGELGTISDPTDEDRRRVDELVDLDSEEIRDAYRKWEQGMFDEHVDAIRRCKRERMTA